MLQDERAATSLLCLGHDQRARAGWQSGTQGPWLLLSSVSIYTAEICTTTLLCKMDEKQMLVPGNALNFVQALILCTEESGHPHLGDSLCFPTPK